MHARRSYELIDVGGGARLERFGDRVVDRPHPAALGARKDPASWVEADLRFDRERGWTGRSTAEGRWEIELAGLDLELRPTEAGQVGLFPEHLAMVPWLQERVVNRLRAAAEPAPGAAPQAPAVLNLFAYTGLATLIMAAAGAAVTHVDSARPTVAWARHNAVRSHLADQPIRWIVDDALAFTLREARRGRRFAGVVMDPPTYGHGPGGRSWRLEDDLSTLAEAAQAVLEPDGFLLLTAHTPGFDGDRLADALGRAPAGRMPGAPGTSVESGPIGLTTTDGRRLELGAFARRAGGA
jgi:23S rRNA (cytosine1962-C5)-methyltransferase